MLCVSRLLGKQNTLLLARRSSRDATLIEREVIQVDELTKVALVNPAQGTAGTIYLCAAVSAAQQSFLFKSLERRGSRSRPRGGLCLCGLCGLCRFRPDRPALAHPRPRGGALRTGKETDEGATASHGHAGPRRTAGSCRTHTGVDGKTPEVQLNALRDEGEERRP